MKLTEKQIIATKHIDGPCLVLAVPGAGKTTMLLERINNLSQQIDKKKILSLTFSRTQAYDMKERYQGNDTNFMTIHAFCYLIIRNYYKKQGRELRILESDDTYNKYNLVKNIYYQTNGRIMSSEELKNFFSEIGYMRNAMLDLSYLRKSQIKNIIKIYDSYERFKNEHSYIDFDDMQVLALRLITENPALLKSIKTRYKYFQLDEGQDTSLLQFKILEKIIYPENNLMVVADDDQSIYGFRAANPAYLLNFKKNYPDAKIITMDENHRSQANIVDASAKFIIKNKYRFEKNLFTQKSPTSKIKIKTLKDSYETYKYIMKHIEQNKTNAILYRNNISSLNILSFMMVDGINFSINSGSTEYFESKIVRDFINIIDFSEDFYNTEVFEDVYYKIKTYLSKEDIEKLALKPINYNVFDYLYEVIDDNKAYNLRQKEKEFNHIRKLPLDRKISYIYHYMGYKDYINYFSSKNYELVMNKDLYIESLINFSKNLKSMDEFKQKVTELNKILRRNPSSNIILSTIHKSKGLEYDNVFVIDLVKNEFPMFIDGIDKESHMEEERRVFYVAMTRAKENLHLLSLTKRNGNSVDPSPFYKDIDNIINTSFFGYKFTENMKKD